MVHEMQILIQVLRDYGYLAIANDLEQRLYKAHGDEAKLEEEAWECLHDTYGS